MNQNEVRAKYPNMTPERPHTDDYRLMYSNTQLYELNYNMHVDHPANVDYNDGFYLLYDFTKDNKLTNVFYSTSIYISSINNVNTDYVAIVNEWAYTVGRMNAIYGTPIGAAQDWANTRYKDNPNMQGTALWNGDYSYHALWETANCYVLVVLYKGDICICYVKSQINLNGITFTITRSNEKITVATRTWSGKP